MRVLSQLQKLRVLLRSLPAIAIPQPNLPAIDVREQPHAIPLDLADPVAARWQFLHLNRLKRPYHGEIHLHPLLFAMSVFHQFARNRAH